MPAPKSYQLKTAAFTPAGGSLINLTSLADLNWSRGGSRLNWSSDGAVAVQAQHMEDLEDSVELSLMDQSILHSANLAVGIGGSLVIVLQARAANGKGATSGQDKTLTFANAIVTGLSAGSPHRGVGSAQISFSCVDPDGASPVAFS